jgi:translation initiation factor IF-2
LDIFNQNYPPLRLKEDKRRQTIVKIPLSESCSVKMIRCVCSDGDKYYTPVLMSIPPHLLGDRCEISNREIVDYNAPWYALNRKDFYLIIKGDTQGSVEAVTASILQLATDEIPIHVIHAATGDISEADILLASANQAVIICFNSGVESTALKSAEKHGIKIRHHNIIYHLMEEVEKMMLGMLSPDELEVEIGAVEVRQVFSISNNIIAGCYVTDGKIVRNCIARVFRGKELLYEGQLSQLKRFKEDAKEVAQGYECGISFHKFNDLKEGDVIKAFEMKSVERTSLV